MVELVDTSDLDSDAYSVKVQVFSQVPYILGLAQPGIVTGLGPVGRRFKSFIRDQIYSGLEKWYLVGLIIRRSWDHTPHPQPNKI